MPVNGKVLFETRSNIDSGLKYSLSDIKLYVTLVALLNTNIQESDIFLDITSIVIQLNRQAGISTSETNIKFRYLLPAISVAFNERP